jgi:pimeloyl-ACP methyl ester carboxylesterase
MTKPGAVVFVHGILGGTETWSALLPHLRKDPFLECFFDLELFNYPSPVARFNPLKRIPDFGDIANELNTALRQEKRFSDRSCLVLVGHSQGGLIIQRLLVDAVRAGQANEELARIRGVVLLATPNSGSELFLSARGALGRFWRHPQERRLRPFNDQIADIHARLLERVVYLPSLWHDIEDGSLDNIRALIEHYLAIVDNVLPRMAIERITGRRLLVVQPGSMQGPV